MLELLKELILGFQEKPLVTGTPRHTRVAHVPGKATVCVGVRRSGKSTFMRQIMAKLLEQGVSPHNILHLNFVDERLHGLRSENLGLILEAYFSMYPEKKNVETIHCFFDEIQVVDGWESFIERIMRAENCEVYITGSSARMLSREIATQMRGRSLSWEMFPFSFTEYLDSAGISSEDHIASASRVSSKQRFILQNAFERYWKTGGFPEVVKLDDELRVKTHQEYFNAVLFRDLIERYDVTHPKAITDLAYRLIDNVGSLFSINSLSGYLHSRDHKLSKGRITEFLDWFEDAYFLFTLRLFDASHARVNANPKKIYCVDHSMVTSVGSPVLINSGHLLENLVFISLRRYAQNVYYYKTRSGREVDFLIQKPDRSRMLVQVCETMSRPDTRKREIASLTDAMSELGLEEGTIVTRSESDVIEETHGRIYVEPAWRFLLRQDEENT